MQVTKITVQQKDKNRVNVYIDNTYALSLTLDQLLYKKLKVGTEVSEQDVQLLTKLSEDGKLRARALEWVMIRPRSSKELKIYLVKKKADEQLRIAITAEFVRKKYQNDTDFARWWAENRVRKNKSNLAIKTELQQKGIPRDIIEEVLRGAGNQNNRLRELINAKKNKPKYSADPVKFKKYLLSKGFRYSDIEEVLAEDIDAEDGNF